MSTKEVVRLPELETLELADFKIASFGSDLDQILGTVRTVAQADWLDRYNAALASGKVASWEEWQASLPEVENDELRALRLVAFASDLVTNLGYLIEDAKDLRKNALSLCQESRENWSVEGRERIVEWLGESVESYREQNKEGDDA